MEEREKISEKREKWTLKERERWNERKRNGRKSKQKRKMERDGHLYVCVFAGVGEIEMGVRENGRRRRVGESGRII